MVVTKISKIHQSWQTFSANGSQLVYKFLVLLFILLFNFPSPLVLKFFGTVALLYPPLKPGLRVRVRSGYGKVLSCVSSWWVISNKSGGGGEGRKCNSANFLIPQSSNFYLPHPHPPTAKWLLLHFSLATSNKHLFTYLKLLQLIKCCHNWLLKKLKQYI